jgi:hypothetical protein
MDLGWALVRVWKREVGWVIVDVVDEEVEVCEGRCCRGFERLEGSIVDIPVEGPPDHLWVVGH